MGIGDDGWRTVVPTAADGMDLRLDLLAEKTAGGWREETE
jgi:hypothetical protein